LGGAVAEPARAGGVCDCAVLVQRLAISQAVEEILMATKKQTGTQNSKLKRKEYEKELRRLQAQLCLLQESVKHQGQRIVIIFEGRDGAGKGGTILAIIERVSTRVFRVVALPASSDREKTQLYMQRYIAHFPAAGETMIFDRSWYNRSAWST
jgi:polyphosphate kinase 2 (PPK2 family)